MLHVLKTVLQLCEYPVMSDSWNWRKYQMEDKTIVTVIDMMTLYCVDSIQIKRMRKELSWLKVHICLLYTAMKWMSMNIININPIH